MDAFEKQSCLYLTSAILTYHANNLVFEDPVYSSTQPSNSLSKSLLKFLFYDEKLDLVPHTKDGMVYDLENVNVHILFSLAGRYWTMSKYKFVNELDYITIMKSVNFVATPNNGEPVVKLFNTMLDNYIGYGLVNKKRVIDTRYLQQFDIRPGYSKLDTVVYLNNDLHFDYCKINGEKRTDEFAIRECMTAIFTVATVENHLFKLHLLVADITNTLLNKLPKSNPLYRILIPFTHDTYTAHENSSISLFGETGFCSMFNFTRDGVVQYYEYVKQNFNFREFLTPKPLSGKSIIHKHQHMWFKCIHKFVKSFLQIQTNLDCDEFLNLMKANYNGIYDANKSSLENAIDICAMIMYTNVVHEVHSNKQVVNASTNPFTVSTTWKQNDRLNLCDKINTLGEQTLISVVLYATSFEAIRLDDERWVDMCCVNELERQIYQKFRKAISKLDIPEDAILHPKNISSSISY
jgi:hypothetical protein